MAVLSAEDLHLAFAAKTIFDGATIAIEVGDRVGVVGRNGTGKSTLLKILSGDAEPDSGRVTRARGVRVGYLAQEHGDPGDGQLLDTVVATAPRRDDIVQRIADTEAELAATADTAVQLGLAQTLADLHAELTMVDSVYAPHRAQSILAGLGFTQADLTRPLREFSGGWRMRAALGSLLYQQPDVLLLDEPTNHLDMPTVSWLSSFLRGFKKALVLTCHDRRFLNAHVKRVASLELEGLKLFKGNYDEYVVQREIELEYLAARQKKDAQKKKELEAFVNRFKAQATKARQAQSKAKLIEKLEADQVELPSYERAVSIQFPPCVRAGETVLAIDGLSFSYDGPKVLDGVDLAVRRGDRIAIVGKNGAGKSTLLKLVCKDLEPTKGSVSYGRNVTPSYFAQHQAEVLGSHQTVVDAVHAGAPALSNTQIRTLCGSFLFSGDDVDKSISVLSGGEKTRVALARMLAAPGNLLLLDEPTNHLDVEASDRLTDSLASYDGTLLFVSHNIDFASRLSNKVWDVHDGTVEVYPGSLADYLDHLARLDAAASTDDGGADGGDGSLVEAPAAGGAIVPTDKAARIAARKARADRQRKISGLEKKVAKAEHEVAERESAIETIEAQLAAPTDDREAMTELSAAYARSQNELERAMERWEALAAKLESAREASTAAGD